MSAPSGNPEVSVVVVTWERRELTLAALASLQEQTVGCRIVLVDNASTDGTVETVRSSYPDVHVITEDLNLGFAGGVSRALESVDTRYVALLNNDAVADPGWLEASLRVLRRNPDVAAVTAKLLLMPASDQPSDDRPLINNAGVMLLGTGYGADRGLGEPDDARFEAPAEVFGFSGGAAVLRTLAVKAVGGFAAEWFMYYEDTDLSWRLRLAGWRIVYEPSAVVHHRHAASSDPSSAMFAFHNERNRMLMLVRDAPLTHVITGMARFVVTTASLTAKRLIDRPVPDEPVFDPRLRLRVAMDVARRLPRTLLQRERVVLDRSRSAVADEWVGVEQRPLPSVR